MATSVYVDAIRKRPGARARDQRASSRSDAVTLPPDLKNELTSITRQAQRSEGVEKLVAALLVLPREDQLLFLHRGIEGQEWGEIANLLTMSAEAARKRWRRLKDDLSRLSVWSEFVDGDVEE
jgi:DNA-directed RNA polymerase specialized sigma24 family protein